MGDFKSWKEESRLNWGRTLDEGQSISREDVVAGAVLRIADAVEKMAKNHQELIESEKHHREVASRRMVRIIEQERSIAALKGVITKLKKKALDGPQPPKSVRVR